MPPKKGAAAAAGPGPEEEEADDGEKELQERDLVIGHLKSRLGGYQDAGVALTVENSHLNEELNLQKINLIDINEFLTKELKAKELSAAALDEHCKALTEELVTVAERQKEKMEAVDAANASKVSLLSEEIQNYEVELQDLREFEEKKHGLEKQLSQLKATLARERREHDELMSDLERLAVQEKDRLKKQMEQQIKETRANMMKLTDNQLEATTKRTIMANEQMSSELALASRQTEKLIARNDQLLKEHAATRRAVDLSKQTEEELMKRNQVHQKTIKALLTKLKSQDSSKRQGEDELARAVEQTDDAASNVESLQGELDRCYADLEEAKAEAEAREEEVKAFDVRQDETARFLITCLQDVKKQIVTVVRDVDGENEKEETRVLQGRLDELSADQRERALGYLLERLHTFQSSKQHRLLGLGRPVDDHLVLPPISSAAAAQDPFAGFGAGPGRGFDGGLEKPSVSMGVQTNDHDLVARQWRDAGKAPVNGHVLADLRPWGKKVPVSNALAYKKRRSQRA